jgi:PAS domain S-box-containing protein
LAGFSGPRRRASLAQDPHSPPELHAELERLRSRLAELEVRSGRGPQPGPAPEKLFTRALMDSMRVPIYVVDPSSYRILDCNQIFLVDYGVEREDAVGRTCYEVTRRRNTPCGNSHQDCPLAETASSGRPSLLEFQYQPPGGEAVDLECATTPVRDAQGGVGQVIHVLRDISHRRRTEQRLRRTNQELGRSLTFLRNLINSSVDAVIAADLTGRILIFNGAARQITGYSEEEAFHHIGIRDLYPGDGAREVMRMLREPDHGGKGKLKSVEVDLRHKDGSPVPISLSAAIVYEGEVEVSTVGFFYDLREKKAMEAELDKTRVQLLQAEKMASIGKLAAGVAHQLNNPLSGITLFGHALKEEYGLPDDAQEDVGRILENAERCRETVKELLQFARQTTQEIRPADLNQALNRTLFLLQNQAQFHNIETSSQLDPALPPVPADIQQLGHVFMNLLLNAADAMEGHGRIEVRTRPSADGRRAVVEVADTGPGIPQQALDHLFEPFYTTKEEGKGTGLGLSVAYGVIQNHGGRITAANRPEGGALFTLELPLTGGEEEEA